METFEIVLKVKGETPQKFWITTESDGIKKIGKILVSILDIRGMSLVATNHKLVKH